MEIITFACALYMLIAIVVFIFHIAHHVVTGYQRHRKNSAHPMCMDKGQVLLYAGISLAWLPALIILKL
ncbi:TMhelix containing protein [Vibrio phage 1.081.O._10N.286.52.C2]|nr:TMhelix containing protein [Vibrio phage 1.081.O._10N.286.52.C2]